MTALLVVLAAAAGAAIGAAAMRLWDRQLIGTLRYQWSLAERDASARATGAERAVAKFDAVCSRIAALGRQRERRVAAERRAAAGGGLP